MLLSNNLGAHCRVRLDPGQEGRRRRRFASHAVLSLSSPLASLHLVPFTMSQGNIEDLSNRIKRPVSQSNSGVVRGGKKASPLCFEICADGLGCCSARTTTKSPASCFTRESVALWVRTVQYGQYSSHLYSTFRTVVAGGVHAFKRQCTRCCPSSQRRSVIHHRE